MNDTIYAVTRVHNQEQNMLDRGDLDRLIAAKTTGEALRHLRDRGWGAPELPEGDPDALIAFEQARTWALVEELAKDLTPFALFRVNADYQNLKAAIKFANARHAAGDALRYMLPGGTIPPESLVKAAQERDYSALPPEMAAVADRATEALLHAGSGQIADLLMDAGALAAIDSAGKASPSEMMRLYARITVDGAVARIALRAARMRLQRDALEIAIPPAGSLDRKTIIAAALNGPEAVLQALESTEYAGAAAEGQKSASAMERWFDDTLMEKLRPQRRVYEGYDPIAAYLIGREREIDAVRLILAALNNHISGDRVAERLRALYV